MLGAGRAVPRGPCPSAVSCLGPVRCLVCLVGGAARSPSPLAWLGVVCPPLGGPLKHAAGAVGAGGAGVWTRYGPHGRTLASWLCALWGRHEGTQGGRLLPGCGASGVGRSANPERPSFGACGPGPEPTGCRCGGCGRGDPSPNPQRALLRAGLARCGGGSRAFRGGASCLAVGRPGSGALPPPTARPSGRAAGAHYPLAVGGGAAGVGTHHQTHSARSWVLALRAVGAAQGRPRGAPLAWLWGVRGRALSNARPPDLWDVRPGPTTHWLWVRGVRLWGPVTKPTARALASWLCAPRGRHEGAWGGRLLPWCGASSVGRSPNPNRPPFRACDRGPLTTGCGCGGCGRGDPSPTPQRALLRAGFARCGGGARAPRGGASCLGVWRPGSGALPPQTAPPFGRAGGAHYPLAAGAGDAGVGTRHRTHSVRSCELALRAVGAARGRPGGGASCLAVRRPGSRALPAPTARPLGRAAGAHYPLAAGAGAAGVGTRHRTHSARSCELALRALGAARGRPVGRLLPGRGASGVGRSPTPDRPSFGAGGRGPGPTGCGCGGRGRGDPSPTPRRALLRTGFAPFEGGSRAFRGGASCLAVGRPWSGALQPPTARPLGRAARAHHPLAVGAGGAGVGTRHLPHSACCCELALRAVGAARGRLGGAPLAWLWGVRGRALSPPEPPVLLGVRPGPTTHWLRVRGVRAWGPVTNPTARSCRLALRAVGEARGRPGGASCLAVGRPGSGAFPASTARPLGRATGARHPLAVGAGGAGVGTRHLPHRARSCAVWGRPEGTRGGAPLAWLWGVRGRALSHPRPPVLWGVRPGPSTHWLWVR